MTTFATDEENVVRDDESSFVAALRQVKNWSANHPGHFPLMVMIEVKGKALGLVPFDTAELNGIDAEILSAFKKSHILKPDDVRSNFETLREAVMSRGCPASTTRVVRSCSRFMLSTC